jgi:hypothetical protein
MSDPTPPAGALATEDRGPSRGVRRLVALALVLLLVPGLIGFEAWPLTAWRLFSLARTDRQTRWVLDAVDADGEAQRVSLEQLPLRYRHAEWPMAELPGASEERRDEVCDALLAAVVDAVPATVELRIVRDRQRLEDGDDGWVVRSEPEVVHTCAIEVAT